MALVVWDSDQTQVRMSSAVQVWKGRAVVEDSDDVFFACRDGVCDGVVEAGRRCVSFLACSCQRWADSDLFLTLAIPDTRVEAIWRQIIEGFRGGILADWYVVSDWVTLIRVNALL